MGETEACLNLGGKTSLENDRITRWAIISDKRAEHDLSTELGKKSRTYVFEGMDDNMLKTSDAVTGTRSCIVGWWQTGSGGGEGTEAIWLAMIDLRDERVMSGLARSAHISTTFANIHWLRAIKCIKFKLAMVRNKDLLEVRWRRLRPRYPQGITQIVQTLHFDQFNTKYLEDNVNYCIRYN